MQVPLIRLQCGVNNYGWGKTGKESAAARFAAATPSDGFSIEDDKPYSEIWMGTHPKTPSKDLETQRPLLDLLKDNQALMSKEIGEKFGGSLPFLFKVLSIDKPLSVQAHPNKKLAGKLHKKDPENYPDDNHKPEMALAITPFEGMCGFRPLAEIEHFFSTVPAFRTLVGEAAVKEFETTVKGQETSESDDAKSKNRKALQAAFSAMMTSEKPAVQAAVKELVVQAKEEGEKFAGEGGPSNTGKELADLVIRLNSHFEGDIGIMALFFLNYVKLAPGEALFLQADDIHAYISGDIIECMANSDNVVRAGFSPKFLDIPTLTSMLTYTYAPISEQKMKPVDYPYATLNRTAYSSGSSAILYDPPIEEFSVVKTELKKPGSKATFEPIQGPSILICTSGKGKITVGPKTEVFNEGYIFFVGATAELLLESTGDECTSYKAFCELSHEGTNAAQSLN